MSDATTPGRGPSTADCEVLTDIHTQSNLAEVEIVSLVQELIPRYRLRAETDFACSNEDFIQTPRIDGSEFEPLTNPQIRALLDYYTSSNDRISQMTKTYHDISAVTRLLEERENDLQMAVTLGHTLLESNDTLRSQVTLLENDIQQTTDIVKQLKHDLILKERLIRFYTDLEESEEAVEQTISLDSHQYQQKIRHLEDENEELRTEAFRLKQEAEHYEQQEQAIVDNFVHALGNANSEIDQLRDEISKKSNENTKQNNEILRLSYEMREIRRRLAELKKENDELKILLSISGKNRDEYESKIHQLEENYRQCLEKLHESQKEINTLQQQIFHLSPSTSMPDLSPARHTVFLSPVEYANFMGIENSLKAELEEILEDPNQLCPSSIDSIPKSKKRFRGRIKADLSDTDGESTVNDSAFSDTESLSSASSCPYCHRCMSDVKSSSTSMIERRRPTSISSKLRLVKRFEGSTMLKRWQELAEPSLSSCLETIPGVYTRAELLYGVHEEEEEEDDGRHKEEISYPLCSSPFVPDPDDDDIAHHQEPSTPPSSPTHSSHLQTNALLQQVMQRLIGISIRTFESFTSSLTITTDKELSDEQQQRHQTKTITPPSSPTFENLIAPTPNTTMRALKSSTFLRVSSLNPISKAFASRSPGEIPSLVNDFLRGYSTRT